ncbi:MAG: hypothetical protein K9G49_16215 [Taibaiella sp.]|nr:hypothetical protein [Taibaiella sp.]
MKTLLCLALLFPVICHAQLELGANAGIAKFSVLKKHNNVASYKTGTVADFTVRYLFKPLSFGVGYSYVPRLSYTTSDTTGTVAIKPLHHLYAFGNYNFKKGPYFGINAGYTSYKINDLFSTHINSEIAFSTGVCVGIIRQLYQGFGLNIQAGANIFFGSTGAIVYFPVTAGLHYRFGQ